MNRPNLEFTLRLNGEPFIVKMTYGLFNEIMAVIGPPENIGELLIRDHGLRDYIVRRMLTGNKRILDEKDMIDPFDMDVDITELDSLINWVGDHVLYFFMTSAKKSLELGQKYEATVRQLTQSSNGSQASTTTTPSAGDSDVAVETSES